jgi:hypothetical protein
MNDILLRTLLKAPAGIFQLVNKNYGHLFKKILYDKRNYLFLQNKNSTFLLQAHIDTHCDYKKALDLYFSNGIVRAKNAVLGADDRAGIYIILELLDFCKENSIELPNVLLTEGEEIGGIGMTKLCERMSSSHFSNIHLALALDRQGCGEYVCYNDLPILVKDYIEDFGWNDDIGTFSDIEIFTDTYGIPSVNLSVGFHNEHTKAEELHLDELLLTFSRVSRMLKKPIGRRYVVTKNYDKWSKWDSYGWFRGNNSWPITKTNNENMHPLTSKGETPRCELCSVSHSIKKLVYIENEGLYLCTDCFEQMYNKEPEIVECG